MTNHRPFPVTHQQVHEITAIYSRYKTFKGATLNFYMKLKSSEKLTECQRADSEGCGQKSEQYALDTEKHRVLL